MVARRAIKLLIDIHGLCNAPSVYCRRRIRNVLVTVTVTVIFLHEKTPFNNDSYIPATFVGGGGHR